MKIYLLDKKDDMITQWKLAFGIEKDVEVVKDDLVSFLSTHPDVDCIVSPANSFGQMTGGFDAAISDYLGWDFQDKVQEYIKTHFRGEQLVGTSFIIDTNKENLRLIHTPTMRIPSIIIDKSIIYQCTRATLLCALENNVQSIVIPAFGGGCGQLSSIAIAALMKKGYKQIQSGHSEYNLQI